jgi:hypothetical protein
LRVGESTLTDHSDCHPDYPPPPKKRANLVDLKYRLRTAVVAFIFRVRPGKKGTLIGFVMSSLSQA